jgi:hypothetical protein
MMTMMMSENQSIQSQVDLNRLPIAYTGGGQALTQHLVT